MVQPDWIADPMSTAAIPTVLPTNALRILPIGTTTLAGAEISAFDPGSNRLFITSSSGLQIVDLADPTSPSLIELIDFRSLGFAGTDITSVAVKGGIVAVALPALNKADNGHVVLLNAADGSLIGDVGVGAVPDMLTFTPDGTKLLVANEGEFLSNGTAGGAGSVSIISLNGTNSTEVTVDFTAFNGQETALRAAGVRIFAGQSVSLDVEPEYIAISADGSTAMVTLQEANAVAILDITTATFTEIVPLGSKSYAGLFTDFSDRDGPESSNLMNLTTGNPVSGLYMPDAIDSYQVGSSSFFVIANEGDDRDDFLNPDETIRLGNSSYDLDDTIFPDEALLKANTDLGRLTVSNAPGLRGDTDNDGDIDQILAYGARSFSILDENGAIVFDSGDMIERIIATEFPSLFDDARSDNKGPEPEGIEVATIGESTYAFVGLERSNITLAFDITNPNEVSYTGSALRPGDVSPEGLLVIAAEDSPTGSALLVTSNEVSNTLSIFSVAPNFRLQLLHFADGEAGLLAAETAPNLAALVDAFDDDYVNTLILAGGDNYIPGPFFAAGTDPTVSATHNRGDNPGAADIEIHNRIGVQASTIGNHEFDFGTRVFSDIVADAAFPYLSSNLDFTGDRDIVTRFQETVAVGGLEEAASLASKIVPSTVVTSGGEQIGLVGATTQIIETISSTGNVEVKGFAEGTEANNMVLLAAQLQPVIDDLIAQGVNKIIVMAHLQQIALEQELATLLRGVDIILAAGSNTRLGDETDQAVLFPGHAADFANTYPIVATGADGGTTLIVNTDNEYTYLGRLVVDFDEAGKIIVESLDKDINGAYASTTENVAAAWGVDAADLATTAFAEGTKGEQVAEITEAVQAVIEAKDGNLFGFTDVYLEGERNLVRNQETNLGNLSADANKTAAEAALVGGTIVASLKNGGGIRTAIGSVEVGSGDKNPPLANPGAGKTEGGISQLDIENSLRFNNLLIVFDTDAAGLKAILEHSVAVLGNQGRFPQIGGISFSFDPDLAAGSRITSIAAIAEDDTVIARLVENGEVSIDAPSSISVVTLNFLANGGDGYPIKANGHNFRYLLADGSISSAIDETLDFTASSTFTTVGQSALTILGEQKAFQTHLLAEYGSPATAFDQADTPANLDQRIQNQIFTADTIFTGSTYEATAGSDVFSGTAADDSFFGGAGSDQFLGGAGNDQMDGGNDDDQLLGGLGNDQLIGGNGSDLILGNSGDDSIFGGTGNDWLLGGEGKDFLYTSFFAGTAPSTEVASSSAFGEGGDDTIIANGKDFGFGGDGNDLLYSTTENAVSFFGGSGDDNLIGNQGNDILLGQEGSDVLIGNQGNDILLGDMGSDVLIGNQGNDVLYGGDGLDFFDLRNDIVANEFDYIADWSVGGTPELIILPISVQPFTQFHQVGSGSVILAQLGGGSSYYSYVANSVVTDVQAQTAFL
ncbi:MAG: alkaline phosphatase [Cyanobium sp.]|nr:MAG: alkaline phosphatase [Cyanobium sp.]